MDRKQLTAIFSLRNWDDLSRELGAIESVEMLSPLQSAGDLERASSRDLLDVVFVDIEQLSRMSSNGGLALLNGAGLYTVLISDRMDPEAMRDAMRAGAKDFLARPFSRDELAGIFERARNFSTPPAQGKKAPRPENEKKKKTAEVLTFFTTKGGAGKSTLATNLAIALSKHCGAKVCLLDLSLQFGDLALILNVKPRATISDLINGKGTIAEEAGAYLSRFGDGETNGGVALLPAPAKPEEADLINKEHVSAIIDALSREYDYLIIDTAPAFNDVSLAALDKSTRVFLIVTPIILSVKNLVGTIGVMKKSLEYPDEKLKVVLNRCDSKSGIGAGDIEKLVGRKIDFRVPSDGNIVVPSLNSGKPPVTGCPKSKFSRAVAEMAISISGPQPAAPGAKAKTAPFWKRLFARRRTAA